MGLLANLVLVFVAGFITALATGLGAVPFFFVEEFNDRWNVALWGVASGIMVSASVFGLIGEGLANGTMAEIVPGLVAGVLLVIVAGRIIERIDVSDQAEAHVAEQERKAAAASDEWSGSKHGAENPGTESTAGLAEPDHPPAASADHSHDHEQDHGHSHDDEHGHDHGFQPQDLVEANFRKLLLILGILTVHSFPEGVAIGVSFADLNLAGGLALYGFTVPVLAVFMTIAISIHNVPEGVAISIPLQSLGMSRWRMVGAAIFSSLPQPIGAVIAYVFVTLARAFLPFGYGFAAGAMIYLVIREFIPEALELGETLPGKGYRELLVGLTAGILVMVPLAFI